MSVSAMAPFNPTDLLSAMGLKVPFPLLPPTQAYKQPPHNGCPYIPLPLWRKTKRGHGRMAAAIVLRDTVEKKRQSN